MNQKKREKTLEDKYGGPEALAAKRREWQAKSRQNYTGNGGLRSMTPERRKEISKLGNQKRWGKENGKENSEAES